MKEMEKRQTLLETQLTEQRRVIKLLQEQAEIAEK